MGGALGTKLAQAGHEICYGVRDPNAPDLTALLARSNGRAKAASPEDAVRFGEVIVNALPWPAVGKVIPSLDLKDKVLLDCTNPMTADFSALEVGTTSSGGELVAQWAPGAKVVKIFNSTGSNNMEDPHYQGRPVPIFYCGDDTAAKTLAAKLAADVGFDPMDAGPLANARLLEPYALLWVWLAFHSGMGREFAFQIVRRS